MSQKMLNSLDGNAYEDFPEYYDLLYQRYFKSVPKFISLIETETKKGWKLLEIAAGTGEVVIPLLEDGYDVTSFDLNEGMLKELQKKASIKGLAAKVIHGDMNEIDFLEAFDLIYMRQSINYFLGENNLQNGLKKINRALKPGGKFIFNAPNFRKEQPDYPVVKNIYEYGDRYAFVLETNELDGRILKHAQDSIVWKDGGQPRYIKDSNDFYMYTKEEFDKSLEKAGFPERKILGGDLRVYKEDSKTIYGVAKK
ncbi:MAG: class I SAM-dependent methyltransferase [bacterium]|nr:class I SAM-dependent methyltransferase [bacterium]